MDLPRHDTLLLRYGEIGLKSHGVRARMERELCRQLEHGLLHRKTEGVVRREQGRLFIESADLEAAADVARHTMGITTFSPVIAVSSDLDTILEAAAAYQRAHWPAGAQSFAVRARRSGNHPYTSQDLAVKAGSAVWTAAKAAGIDVRVDLGDPTWEMHIEVRGSTAYLFHERFAGPGGLPLGSQGKMVLLLDSGDAVAAAYLMMRRGASVYPIYFPQLVGTAKHPGSPTSEDAGDHPALTLLEHLRRWHAPMQLKAWWFDDDVVDAVSGEPAPDDGVPLAHACLEAAARYAHMVKAQAIVTGETVRAPWAARLPDAQAGISLPVLRPVMGLRRAIIDDFREQVGLARLAGPRADESERVYTAGGRRESRDERARAGAGPREVSAAPEGTTWDPW